MSDIPKAREMLFEVVSDLLGLGQEDMAFRVADAINLLRRRPPVRPRAPRSAPPMTTVMAEFLRNYALSNPTLSHREIGQRFGIDGGRVSEALHGDR